MKLLLDTHVFLWWLADQSKISSDARNLIEDRGNQVFVSMVVLWEISIKRSIGKLVAPFELQNAVQECDFDILPIEIKHIEYSEKLPWLHRDPFDRLMISQAFIEQATILSKDPIIAQYTNNFIVP